MSLSVRNTCSRFGTALGNGFLTTLNFTWQMSCKIAQGTVAATQAVCLTALETKDFYELLNYISQNDQRRFDAKLILFTGGDGLKSTLLLEAAKVNKLSFVQSILNQPGDLFKRELLFALKDAARHNNEEMIRALLPRCDAIINLQTKASILEHAIVNNSLTVFNRFLSDELNANQCFSLIQKAFELNRVEMITALIQLRRLDTISLNDLFKIFSHANRPDLLQLLPLNELSESQRGIGLRLAVRHDHCVTTLETIIASGTIAESDRTITLQRAVEKGDLEAVRIILNSGSVTRDCLEYCIDQSIETERSYISAALIIENGNISPEKRALLFSHFLSLNRLAIAESLISTVGLSDAQYDEAFSAVNLRELLSHSLQQDLRNLYFQASRRCDESIKMDLALEAINHDKELALDILNSRFNYNFNEWLSMIMACLQSHKFSLAIILLPQLIASIRIG
jgi:hypothetical protein